MRNKRYKQFSLVVVVVVALLMPGAVALAESGEGYELTWWTVDSGGVVGQDGMLPYSLGGTAGQPDAALWQGGDYTLQGGFWRDAGPVAEHYIYLPLVLRQS